MQNSKEVVILRAYRPFLTYLTVFELDNFRNINSGRILARNIGRAVGVTLIFVLITFIFLGSEFIVSYNHQFDLNEVAQQVSYVILVLPAPFIYLYLFWKSSKIVETIDHLHGIVAQSKS